MTKVASETIRFTDEEVQQLFGHEAAEDEDPARLRQYYFKSTTFNHVANDLPIRILVGHKGIGKSALFQVAMAEDRERNRLTLTVKPDDVLELGEDTGDFIATVRDWKAGLLELLAAKAVSSLGSAPSDAVSSHLKQIGGHLLEFLRAGLSDPSWFKLDPAKKAIADHFLRTSQISVYIDDLDRGWQGRRNDIVRISSLLNAIRDLANENRGLRFRVSLRSDVYFLVRTSDESTDKIEGSVVWHSWTNHEIFLLLIKRIETFFGRDFDIDAIPDQVRQRQLARFLSPVFEPHFIGKGHWANAPTYRVLMSLIRKRPRDLVKLCSLAGHDAHTTKSSRIGTRNLEHIFEEYSQGRIQDTINEFRSELREIDRLLFGMKPSRQERTARKGYTYTTAELLAKLKNVEQSGVFNFGNGTRMMTKDLAAFLYKINFITARREEDDGTILRRYFEESRYLQNQFVEFGFDWEVHPAYRWALQPGDPLRVIDTLRLSSDESN